LGSDEGIFQPSVVLDSTLPEPGKETDGKSDDDHSFVGIVTVVSDLVILATGQEFIMSQGVLELVA